VAEGCENLEVLFSGVNGLYIVEVTTYVQSVDDNTVEKETALLVLLVLLGMPDKDTSSTHISLIKTGSL
jgi:hypothetical protein